MITFFVMPTCIAIKIGGDLCGRETEDKSDYCFIHRDLDQFRGLKDIADYITGGTKYIGIVHSIGGIAVIFTGLLAQHQKVPMARIALKELDTLKTDIASLISELEAEEGTQHSQEEAEARQERLSAIVDRLNDIRLQIDQIIPSEANKRDLFEV